MTYQPTHEQEKALRSYLRSSVMPLIEQVLVKKLGQAMTFAATELVQPKRDWQGLTDEQITAGARALCQQMAEACNVDAGDQWQLYADTFKEDAKAVLTAAAKLREKNN